MRQLKITKSITNRESASLDKYLQEIGREELITVEEEVELAQRIRKGDQAALEKLSEGRTTIMIAHRLSTILAVDEITAPEDIKALESAQGCGVKLLATAHGCGREDLERRGLYRQLLEKGLVEKLVLIRRQGEQRIYRVEELR